VKCGAASIEAAAQRFASKRKPAFARFPDTADDFGDSRRVLLETAPQS
jgi:hypothetical protein